MSATLKDCPVPNMTVASSSPKRHVLFVDDDADVLKAAKLLLERNDLRMTAARTPAEAWVVLGAEPVDVVLLDLNFTRGAVTGEEGFAHLAEIMRQDPAQVVVVVTGHSGVSVAVAAMRAGAADFVMKPWSNERLLATIRTAFELRRTRREAAALRAENIGLAGEAFGSGAPLLGDSPAIERVRDLILKAAPTNAPVLVLGPAGSGKSLIARNIHSASRRADAAFVSVDLASASAEDAERMLFGDPSGSGPPGAFIDAAGGTVYLDEIAALSPRLQGALLTVLETGRTPGGAGRRPAPTDVRLIASTRRSREALHARGGVREDLLYRLNTVEVFAPPLSGRGRDALILARHFLHLGARRYGGAMKPLSLEAEQAILAAPWPGDVRALRQAMERCVIFAEGDQVEARDVFGHADANAGPTGSTLVRTEKTLVEAALKRSNFNVSAAAKALGVSRAALYRRMAKHGL